MDNTMARELAQSDPVLFFQTYKPPVLIDEVQKAPELFEQIKIICDESDEKGLIWLTGSQQYNMMKKVNETFLPEELAFWSYTAYPQEKKQGLYSIRIWIFRLPRWAGKAAESSEERCNSGIPAHLGGRYAAGAGRG